MREALALGLLLLLPGCVSERHFIHDSWPFGNPNAPIADSETAYRALGRAPTVTPITPQAGDVWPGPVQAMPTLGQVEQQMNQPLGQGFTPSVPSPYPPGIDPDTGQPIATVPNPSAPLYSTAPGVVPDVQAVPGHVRNGGVNPGLSP